MQAAGVELWADQRDLAVGGIFEIATSLPRVIATWRKMLRCLRETDPDVVVFVDSGGFNLPFAKRVRAVSRAKGLYYLAPQVWAWRESRLHRLAKRVDRIAVILPFEPAYYAEREVQVDFVGHPAVDALVDKKQADDEAIQSRSDTGSARIKARARFAIGDGDRVLGLFPGSRRNELERHLPIQLESFLRLRARFRQSLDWLRVSIVNGPWRSSMKSVRRYRRRCAYSQWRTTHCLMHVMSRWQSPVRLRLS